MWLRCHPARISTPFCVASKPVYFKHFSNHILPSAPDFSSRNPEKQSHLEASGLCFCSEPDLTPGWPNCLELGFVLGSPGRHSLPHPTSTQSLYLTISWYPMPQPLPPHKRGCWRYNTCPEAKGSPTLWFMRITREMQGCFQWPQCLDSQSGSLFPGLETGNNCTPQILHPCVIFPPSPHSQLYRVEN